MILPVYTVARSTGVDPGFARPISEWVPHQHHQSHPRPRLASSNWCPGFFPGLAAMGNFANGWVVIGPRCARDLEDNHILTGLSGFPITSHSPSSSDCDAGLERKLMPPKSKFTIHLPFWYGLRRPPVWKSEMIR